MKKRVWTGMLACLMAVCLMGCGGGKIEPGGTSASDAAAETGYTFTYNGTKIAMHADAEAIVKALGEPKSYNEETSCAFEGLDKTYYYGGFYLETYPQGEKDCVSSVWFADDSVETEEGVCVGDSKEKVESVYGADAFNGTNAYELTKGKSKLTIVIKDDAVSSIQYAAVQS